MPTIPRTRNPKKPMGFLDSENTMCKTARKREPGNSVPSNRIESGYPEFTVRGKNKQKKEAKKGIRAYFSSYMRLPARQGKVR